MCVMHDACPSEAVAMLIRPTANVDEDEGGDKESIPVESRNRLSFSSCGIKKKTKKTHTTEGKKTTKPAKQLFSWLRD